MKKEILFFNYYHNGDIHVSREFVKDILKKTETEVSVYHHPNSDKLLLDINNLIIKKDFLDESGEKLNNSKLFYENDNFMFINTWFHIDFGCRMYGCTLEALYSNFSYIYEQMGIELEKIEYYIPKIDFSKYNVDRIDDFFSDVKKYDKYIFISNGPVKSNQSDNVNLNDYIKHLSNVYKNCLFILSENVEDGVISDNVILSSDIIKLDSRNDLVENSYLSTKCDMIVGRHSGPYTYSMIQQNILSDKKQDFIHISPDKPFLEEKYYNENKKLHKLNHSSQMVECISKLI